ncbi:MAG: DUF1624 domain-containing protein [Oscillospiraceae bacterium]|jgi:uncharacterized membrane protein|nr:DUF1624 domain-containing protein [Oscillospiraceae bacterium]
MKGGRIQLLDALRGLSILLVIAYHAGYNLAAGGYMPAEVLYNPLLNVLQPLFAGVFILLAGISGRFSRSNLRRGAVTAGCAALVSAAAWLMGTPIWFGILHLLAVCMLLYWLAQKINAALPLTLAAAFLLTLFSVTRWPVLESADYFPIVPWGFLFMLGTWLGGPIKDGKLPRWFYNAKVPLFPVIGRYTLIIYMLHQPALHIIMLILPLPAATGG